MSERIQPVSALGGAVAEAGLACRIEEIGPTGMITLRGDFTSDAFRKAVDTGFPDVCRITGAAGGGAAWMSPDEVLLMCPYGEAGTTLTRLHKALSGQHYMAVDVSDARAVFRLTGRAVREVLAKGAPVDMSPGAFQKGHFRRTRLGQVAVAFGHVGSDPEVFELICFRSVAGFVFNWLQNAAQEGSMPEFL